jgi:hypothetical protein
MPMLSHNSLDNQADIISNERFQEQYNICNCEILNWSNLSNCGDCNHSWSNCDDCNEMTTMLDVLCYNQTNYTVTMVTNNLNYVINTNVTCYQQVSNHQLIIFSNPGLADWNDVNDNLSKAGYIISIFVAIPILSSFLVIFNNGFGYSAGIATVLFLGNWIVFFGSIGTILINNKERITKYQEYYDC